MLEVSEEEPNERRKDSTKIREQLETLLKTLKEIEVEYKMFENEINMEARPLAQISLRHP